ncbi:hypothetical protein IFM89_024738 [Coptis chinensis]|uniref:Uncharacterized protein n=1 Tax=Coptis chinensis TaxID=261450 RepID=A0A835H808_9MAGN|nr:hypothetical protein IFM89_024738 [Coptis chinensis]
MDYITEFTVAVPILILTGTSDCLPDGEHVVQVYCVQTHAIQQYVLELSQCLPPTTETTGLEKSDSGVYSELNPPSSDGFGSVDSVTVSDAPEMPTPRGNDIPHSPVMCAYLIVETAGAKLFIDNSKVTPEVMTHLKDSGVELRLYESILSEIDRLAAKGVQLWLGTSSVNAAIVNTYRSACDKYLVKLLSKNKSGALERPNGRIAHPSAVYRISPISMAKAVKNKAELEGMQSSHLRYIIPFT